MRILFVNQYFPPDAAASAYLLGELAEDLALDHEVRVIAGRPSYNPDASVYRPDRVRVTRCWSTTFSRGALASRAMNYATFLFTAFFRAMGGPRPDVVVALTDPPVIGLIGLLAARRHRVPFVYVCMDIFPDVGVALGRVDHPALVRLWRRLNGRIRLGASRVVAIGRDMEEKLRAEGVPQEKIAFLPNWANEPPAHPDINAIRDRYGWHGKRVVMHAGNMGLAQNLQIVIEAAEALRHDAPEVQFVFMGDGAVRESLMAQAHSRMLTNITFLDYQPKDSAQATIAAANVHLISLAPGLKGSVVPSKVYGLLSAGIPFVAAVDEGSEVDRIILEGGCGIQIDPGDGARLAKALLAASDEELWAMGKRGREIFETRYTRPMATSAYLRMLESVARAQAAER